MGNEEGQATESGECGKKYSLRVDTSKKLYIALVGLPAMGKSTMGRKLKANLTREGLSVEIFNNGEVRRKIIKENTSHARFYDPSNTDAQAVRERIAYANIQDAKKYLAGHGNVAILDATNASRKRRELIEHICSDHPILYIECVNNDPDSIDASVTRKAKLQEFSHLPFADAYSSFMQRIDYYRRIHNPLREERNFFVIDSLNLVIAQERITDAIPHYGLIRDLLVSDWIRTLYLCRHGQSAYNVENRIGGDPHLTRQGYAQADALAAHFSQVDVPYVFTSSRQRTIQMAEPLLAAQPDCKHYILPEFDEIDAGQCEGMTYEEVACQHPDVMRKRAADKFNYVYPGGEGYVTLQRRVFKGLKKALYLSGNMAHTMIIGHQAVNRAILSLFMFRPKRDIPFLHIPQNRYFHIISTHSTKLFELRNFEAAPAKANARHINLFDT